MREKAIENIFITPCFPQKFSFTPKENLNVDNANKKSKLFVIGETYSLSGVECDDFKMPKKEYKLIGLVSNINGVALDSVIMKQISGEYDTIFSLTKHDCRNLNIEFQNGLQLFPKNLNWVKVENKKVEIKKEEQEKHIFDPNNLSTYPLCHIDNTVRHILVEISCCDYISSINSIVLPNGIRIKKSLINERLLVKLKRPLYGNNNLSANFSHSESIPYRILTNEVGKCTTNNIVDNKGKIYIELFLAKRQNKKNVNITSDGYIGVDHSIFDNQNFNDIFEIITLDERIERINKSITIDDVIDKRMELINKRTLSRLLNDNFSTYDSYKAFPMINFKSYYYE